MLGDVCRNGYLSTKITFSYGESYQTTEPRSADVSSQNIGNRTTFWKQIWVWREWAWIQRIGQKFFWAPSVWVVSIIVPYRVRLFMAISHVCNYDTLTGPVYRKEVLRGHSLLDGWNYRVITLGFIHDYLPTSAIMVTFLVQSIVNNLFLTLALDGFNYLAILHEFIFPRLQLWKFSWSSRS